MVPAQPFVEKLQQDRSDDPHHRGYTASEGGIGAALQTIRARYPPTFDRDTPLRPLPDSWSLRLGHATAGLYP